MAEKIKKGAMRAYFKMLKVWSVLLLGIVGIFCSKDVWAEGRTYSKYGVSLNEDLDIKNHWQGISGSKAYTEDSYKIIKDKDCFGKEWKKLGISEALPQVNFNKNIMIAIIKKNSSKELSLRRVFHRYEGNKIFVNYEFHIDTSQKIDTLSYLFIMIEKTDYSIIVTEYRSSDKDKNYVPINCDFKNKQNAY